MTPEKIRVVVADDHPTVLRGTCEMIEEAPEFEVVGQARTGEQALNQVMAQRPDVVLLDIQMPGKDGIEVVKELRARGQALPILMLSAAEDEDSIVQALQAGANGYLIKTATEDELHQALRMVVAGETAILQPVVARALVASHRKPAAPALPEPLSDRELDVLKTLAKDLGNKEIAARLGISDRTVQYHLANIFGKLGVASRTGAVVNALNLGLITLEDTRP